MLTSGLGSSRGRLAALSCAMACTAVAAAWHLRARRRVAASRRAGCSSENALTRAAGGDDSCDAPDLVAAFQVRRRLAERICRSLLKRSTAPRLSRMQQALPLVSPRTARTSSGCSCTRCTSRPPWARAPRRRPRASTSLHTPNGAPCAIGPRVLLSALLMLRRSKALVAAAR